MVDSKIYKNNVAYNKKVEQNTDIVPPNPLRLKDGLLKFSNLTSYSQVVIKPVFDRESVDILNKVDEMLKLSPEKLSLPYSFILEEINGERFYDSSGSLKLIREYDGNMIREYFPAKDDVHAGQIIESDKNTGNVISKTEPALQHDGTVRINIIIFDEKINNKYTMFQVEDGGLVSSITEFLGNGKNFRTVFKNLQTKLPERYIESTENSISGFELIDCKLNPEVSEIKYITSENEINIKYEGNKKIIDVRKKMPEG